MSSSKLSPSARKLHTKLKSILSSPATSSLESRQTIASWMIFNRKKSGGLCEGLLVAVEEAATDAATDDDDINNGDASARLMLLLRVIHQVLISNNNSTTQPNTVDDTWDKSLPLRVELGEAVLPTLFSRLARSFYSDCHRDQQQQQQYQSEVKEMIDIWKQYNVFDSPTVWEGYKRCWGRCLEDAIAKEEAVVGAAAAGGGDETKGVAIVDNGEATTKDTSTDVNIAKATDTTTLMGAAKQQAAPGISTANVDDNVKPAAGSTRDDISTVSFSKTTSSPTSSPLDRTFTRQDSTLSTTSLPDTTTTTDIDYSGVEPCHVEPSQFLDACKVIAQIQITRDLGGDAAMNLSAVLGCVSEQVEEACGTVYAHKSGDDGSVADAPSISDLLSPETLSNLPDEFLDLDLKYARQSLQTYKEAIRQQRKARLQCLHLLLQSRCDFGSMDAARLFCERGRTTNQHESGEDTFPSMDVILEQLKKKKEALSDALALEGLDVEEDAEEEKKLEKEERDLVPLSWFPCRAGGECEEDGDGVEVDEEPTSKKLKMGA
ncbi:predicted protein [Thalassiosira pseudonana CCMP1335]|uniref:CID domain-containing protein n=1 Tax=Thalassiosira pseudonana TaxID=35128 RepID=B8LEM1_THAPS|nr:predicted protein [Thalassiosira pseudonana CCMP1335]EED86222.1 predicted protein [Thalassiosira pseudonana CCMP1335]